MTGYRIPAARPVALALLLAAALPGVPAQVADEDPIFIPAGTEEKAAPDLKRVHRGTRCVVRAGEGVAESDMAAAARPADWALGELELLLGTMLPKPLEIRMTDPRDARADLQPGSAVQPAGNGILAALTGVPAIPRGGEIVHELTHECIDQATGNTRTARAVSPGRFPRLLNEGLAEALRWRWVGEATGGSRDSLRHLRRVCIANMTTARRGVRDIVSFSDFVSRHRPESASHFAHGWALSAFLLDRPKGPECLRAVVEGVRKETNGLAAFDAAVRAAFGESPEAFEASWRRWVDERWEGVLREARKVLDADPAKAESARRDVEALGDADFGRREAACRRLVALGDAAIPLVQPLLGHEDAEVRARARAVLDRLLEP
jgi:hypothetical protein